MAPTITYWAQVHPKFIFHRHKYKVPVNIDFQYPETIFSCHGGWLQYFHSPDDHTIKSNYNFKTANYPVAPNDIRLVLWATTQFKKKVN